MVNVRLGGHDCEMWPGGRVLLGRGKVIMRDMTSVCDSIGARKDLLRWAALGMSCDLHMGKITGPRWGAKMSVDA